MWTSIHRKGCCHGAAGAKFRVFQRNSAQVLNIYNCSCNFGHFTRRLQFHGLDGKRSGATSWDGEVNSSSTSTGCDGGSSVASGWEEGVRQLQAETVRALLLQAQTEKRELGGSTGSATLLLVGRREFGGPRPGRREMPSSSPQARRWAQNRAR